MCKSPWKGKNKKTQLTGFSALEFMHPGLVGMLIGPGKMWKPVYQVQAASEAHLEWKILLVVQSLKLTNPIPVISVTCCCGPSGFSKLLSAVQPGRVNGTLTLTMHGKDFGIQLALLFPCSILAFDLPLAIVSKDHGMSITF